MGTLTIVDKDIEPTVTADEVAAVIRATRVANVRLDEVHAGPLAVDGGDLVYDVQAEHPKFAYVEEARQILVRIEHGVRVSAEESSERTTEITVAHVISFDLADDLEARPAALAAWVESNVYFLAYPYVRETLTSLTSRMGLPPLTLDYLSRDERPFRPAADED
ncbi:hypothetical protein ACT3SQ_14955 [Brachybacterium sp. AOP42-C2-15]